ncbi:MAG: Rne/Rng family ribonuclease [Hyphomicrobiaceae bacterium]|nr:Rne/Rng family ribonuclease [Hyphomicrobiaceae bacterium]
MDKHNKMLIDATHPEETRVVVLRDGRVEEFDFESASRKPLRGNIYLAKVTRVEPSLQAAFVDYGGNRHGFLAFSEIHPDYYQIPVADRQALLDEEAAAEAEAEAEADARAEARDRRRHGRGAAHAAHDDEENGDGEPQDGHEVSGAEGEPDAHGHGHEHEHEHEAVAADAHTSAMRHGDPAAEEVPAEAGAEDGADTGGDADNGEGEHHVEEVSETGEAPEVLSAETASQDALEELPERPRRRMRSYKIQEVIKRRQIILVQVVKEERGNKGAALTTYLSLAGRYTVLMPNTGRGGGISRKITNPQDRKRLKAIAHELEVPEGMGLIIRTAGAARTKQEIKRDFEYEIRLWESVREMTLRSTAPCLVYEEGNLIKRSIRDLYSKDVEDIVVAGEAGYTEALDFMKMLSPSQMKNVVRYEGAEPIFHRYQIERQLNAMFSPFVTLRSGGYLVINQTEALVAVDVNSGKSTREYSIEETALNTNLEAAEEVSRQLKLRDLAGLIVIDFIDMEEKRNNRAVERRLKDCLRHDRARIQIGRISHFGLLEMSRQRLRTGVLEGSTSQCPHCQGTGIIRSVESVALAVLRGIEDHLLRDQRHSINVATTADVALYILNNKRAFITAMEARYGLSIMVHASDKVQGANFAIERSHPATAKQPERSTAVNMDWGFDGQEEAPEGDGEDAEGGHQEHRRGSAEGGEAREGGGRRRRRRRRGRRDDRGEDRAGYAGRQESYVNGEPYGDEGGYAEPEEGGPEPARDSEPAHEASGEDEGEGGPTREANEGEREERQGGRRRRRGRRGGRRGRDRGERTSGESNGNGEHHADAPADDTGETDGEEAEADAPAAPAAHDVHDTAEHRHAEGNGHGAVETEAPMREPEAPPAARPARASDIADRIPHVEAIAPAPLPEPAAPVVVAVARSAEPKPIEIKSEMSEEDASRPARKGWWQRRFTP